MKMESEGHTLWLMPKGQHYQRFADLIKKLAKEYNGPIFEPHVTLLGNFPQPEEETIRLTEQLAANQKPFFMTLEQISYEDFHFRTLFVKARITHELQSLHNKARQIFNMQQIPPYMAHLSILYGVYPNNLKEKIIAEISRDQTAEWEVNSVALVKGGLVEDWKIIGEFPFKP